jgi:hypothetical protein
MTRNPEPHPQDSVTSVQTRVGLPNMRAKPKSHWSRLTLPFYPTRRDRDPDRQPIQVTFVPPAFVSSSILASLRQR